MQTTCFALCSTARSRYCSCIGDEIEADKCQFFYSWHWHGILCWISVKEARDCEAVGKLSTCGDPKRSMTQQRGNKMSRAECLAPEWGHLVIFIHPFIYSDLPLIPSGEPVSVSRWPTIPAHSFPEGGRAGEEQQRDCAISYLFSCVHWSHSDSRSTEALWKMPTRLPGVSWSDSYKLWRKIISLFLYFLWPKVEQIIVIDVNGTGCDVLKSSRPVDHEIFKSIFVQYCGIFSKHSFIEELWNLSNFLSLSSCCIFDLTFVLRYFSLILVLFFNTHTIYYIYFVSYLGMFSHIQLWLIFSAQYFFARVFIFLLFLFITSYFFLFLSAQWCSFIMCIHFLYLIIFYYWYKMKMSSNILSIIF